MANGNYMPMMGRNLPADSLQGHAGYSHALSGSGAPEGSVEGIPNQIYTDTVSGLMYIKVTGTGNVGWRVNGSASGAGGVGSSTKGCSLVGTIDPPNTIGLDGQTYVNTTTNALFWKSGGVWQPT